MMENFEEFYLGWFILAFIFIICIIVLIFAYKKYRKRFPKEGIIEDINPEIIYINGKCPECGNEILDETEGFCSMCGVKIK